MNMVPYVVHISLYTPLLCTAFCPVYIILFSHSQQSILCLHRLYKQLAPIAVLLLSLTFVHFCLSLWKTLVTASRQTDRQTGWQDNCVIRNLCSQLTRNQQQSCLPPWWQFVGLIDDTLIGSEDRRDLVPACRRP